jgi:hypothetical protein
MKPSSVPLAAQIASRRYGRIAVSPTATAEKPAARYGNETRRKSLAMTSNEKAMIGKKETRQPMGMAAGVHGVANEFEQVQDKRSRRRRQVSR